MNPGNSGRGREPHPKIQNHGGGRPRSSGRSAFQLEPGPCSSPLGRQRVAVSMLGGGEEGVRQPQTASSRWARTEPLETEVSAPLSQPRRDSCVLSPSTCLPSDADPHPSSKNADPSLKKRPPLGIFSDPTSPGSRLLSTRLCRGSAPLLGLRPQPGLLRASTGRTWAFSPTKGRGPPRLRLLPKRCPLPPS